jgi:hypothetical protein
MSKSLFLYVWGDLKPEYRGQFFPRETIPILASTILGASRLRNTEWDVYFVNKIHI